MLTEWMLLFTAHWHARKASLEMSVSLQSSTGNYASIRTLWYPFQYEGDFKIHVYGYTSVSTPFKFHSWWFVVSKAKKKILNSENKNQSETKLT